MSSKKPNLLIVTAYTPDYESESWLTSGAMQDYARRHGYNVREFTRQIVGRGNWAKIDVLCDLLDPRSSFYAKESDHLLWLDTDALFIRNEVDIATEIDPAIDLKMTWHEIPATFGDAPHYNSGVMLIRRSEWSLNFFRKVQATGQINHKWADQATIHHLLGYDDVLKLGPGIPGKRDNKIGNLDLKWNSIPGVISADNAIIHHHAGVPRKYREQLLRLDRASVFNEKRSAERSKVIGEFRKNVEHIVGLERKVEELAVALDESKRKAAFDLTSQLTALQSQLDRQAELNRN